MIVLAGMRMSEARLALGLGVVQFAKKIECSRIQILAFERGDKHVSLNEICALYESYRVSANWLLFGVGEMFLPEGHSIKSSDFPEGQTAQWRQMRDVKNRINELRAHLGFTLFEFGAAIDMAPSTMGSMGSGGSLSYPFIGGVFRVFGISADWLLFGEGEMFLPSHDAKNPKLEKGLKEMLDTYEEWAHPPYPALIHREFETDLTILKSASAVHSCKPFSAEEVVVEQTEEERDAAARMLAANIKMQFDNALENTPRAPSVVFLFLIGGFCGLWLLFFKLIGVL